MRTRLGIHLESYNAILALQACCRECCYGVAQVRKLLDHIFCEFLPKFYILEQLGDCFQSVDISLCLGIMRRKLSKEERIYIIKQYYSIGSADGVQKE